MRKYIWYLIILLFVSCEEPTMTNDEIIEEISKCKSNNLEPMLMGSSFTMRVRHVVCIPK